MYTLSGGSAQSPVTYIGYGGTGTFVQTGGTHSAGAMIMGESAGSIGTYMLNAGTLTASSVTGGAGSSVFDFNGGTLKPTASNSAFMTGLTTANVQTGGAIINPNGFAITIAQPLLHDTTLGRSRPRRRLEVGRRRDAHPLRLEHLYWRHQRLQRHPQCNRRSLENRLRFRDFRCGTRGRRPAQ